MKMYKIVTALFFKHFHAYFWTIQLHLINLKS